MYSYISPINSNKNLYNSQALGINPESPLASDSVSEKLTLHANIPDLEIDTEEIDNLIRIIDSLTNAKDVQTLEQITIKLENEIEQLNKYLTSTNIPSEEAQLAEDVIGRFIQVQGVNKLASKIVKVGAKGLSIQDARLDNYQDNTELLSVAAAVLSELVDLSHLLQKNSVLNTQNEQLQRLKGESPQDLRKIEHATRIVNELENEVNKLNEGFFVHAITSAPSLGEDIYGAVRIITNQAEIVGVSAGLAIGAGVAAIISAAYRLHQTKKTTESHGRHLEALKPNELLETIYHEKPDELLHIHEKKQEPLHLNKMHIDLLRKERKKNFDARVLSSGPSFDRWISQLVEKNSRDFNQFKVELEKKGFTLSENILNFEDFEKELNNTPAVKASLQIKFFEHLDTLTSISKDNLRERLLASEKVNQNFFSFKLKKSKVMFGVTAVTAIAGIALSVGLIAGAVFPPALFIIPGIIGAVATFGFIGLGLYHLHNNKPNLAGTIFRFVKANILLHQIPLLFSDWRLAKAREEQSRLEGKITSLSTKVLSDKNQKKLDRYLNAKTEADETVQFCEKRYNMYCDKIKSLEDEIVQARKDDFELNTGFKSFEKKGAVTYIDGMAIESLEDLKDEFTIISDALIEGEFWKDPEANAFLKKYGGVELANEVQLDTSKLGENSNFLSEKLRHVILRNSKELLAWLEKEDNKGPVR